jgi:hypothetical protein
MQVQDGTLLWAKLKRRKSVDPLAKECCTGRDLLDQRIPA